MGSSNVEIYEQFLTRFPLSRLKFRVATSSWVLEGRSTTIGELARLVAFEIDASKSRVENMLAHAAREQSVAASQQIRAWLTMVEARPVDDGPLREWLRLLGDPGTSELMHEANVVAMKQWIWQVKRNVAERPVVWHVAPIFWSTAGGTGKSFNVKRLFAPLNNFSRSLDVHDLGEKFSGPLLAQTLVAFFDEFAGAEQVNTAQLKAILTGKDIDSRAMYSEAGFHAKNRVSCIATSNLAPPHGFVDTTGARRFWSIKCSSERMDKGSPRMAQFDAMNIDPIWQAISVEDQSPQYTTPEEVRQFMEQERERRLRTKSSLENFCEECLTPNEGDRLKLKDLVQHYKGYCADTRQPILRGGYRVLRDHLVGMGLEVVNHANLYYLKHYGLQQEAQFES
jgi:hypothetical protein